MWVYHIYLLPDDKHPEAFPLESYPQELSLLKSKPLEELQPLLLHFLKQPLLNYFL